MTQHVTLPDKLTIGESYGPAMHITSQEEAREYLRALVDRHVRLNPDRSREGAIHIELLNLGYYAGYFDQETRARVLRLFGARHPYLDVDATDEEAFRVGLELGRAQRGEESGDE